MLSPEEEKTDRTRARGAMSRGAAPSPRYRITFIPMQSHKAFVTSAVLTRLSRRYTNLSLGCG
jgi:hypothetical protein